MRKTTFIVLLTFLTAASLASCGKNNNINTEETTPVVTEITAAETEAATIAPQELDAFECVAYYLDRHSGAYRNNDELTINLDLSESPYADYMHYNMEVLSADCDTIKVRAIAQTDELIDWLNDRKCTFKTNTFDFEIPVSDLPCQLISENLYYDNRSELEKSISEKAAEEISGDAELKEIYLALPETDSFDVSKQNSISCNKSDGTTNRSNVSIEQSDADYSVYGIFESENGFYLVSCTPFFKSGVYETGYTYDDYRYDMDISDDDCKIIDEVFVTTEDAVNKMHDIKDNSNIKLKQITE